MDCMNSEVVWYSTTSTIQQMSRELIVKSCCKAKSKKQQTKSRKQQRKTRKQHVINVVYCSLVQQRNSRKQQRKSRKQHAINVVYCSCSKRKNT